MRICRKCDKPGNADAKICRACGGILEEVPGQESPVVATLVERQREPRTRRDPRLPRPSSKRSPLGLPSGSIRALLTLMVVAVVVIQIGRGRELELLWAETLMIALAHYFTSRRTIHLAPELTRKLAEEGVLEMESNPLYLPKHSVRAILILTFTGLALYLYQEHRLFDPPAVSILGVVFAYFLGVFVRFKGVAGWEDVKAAVVVGVLFFTALAYLLDQTHLLPPAAWHLALALVLFYFGSR